MLEGNAFSIERHALKITQPLEETTEDEVDLEGLGYRLKCPRNDPLLDGTNTTRLFGRMDFSKGFPQWWFLSHIDFKVPSEHTQEGKRYSAEVQMAHFYSKPVGYATTETPNEPNENEMATVSVFLEAFDDHPPYPFLDKVICEWRRVEDEVRDQCGLPSIDVSYPGCFNYGGDESPTDPPVVPTTEAPTFSPSSATSAPALSPMTDTPAAPPISGQRRRLGESPLEMRAGKKGRVILDPQNFREPEMTEEEWGDWAYAQSALEGDEEYQRQLANGTHTPFFHNYQFMIDVRTEYYFRYQGTSTIPPCYAEWDGTRGRTNHWRVLKDPIRVHERQIAEMERLLRERVAPETCQEGDTAAKVDSDGKVSVARPLMQQTEVHYQVS